jgi:hypothetical protein
LTLTIVLWQDLGFWNEQQLHQIKSMAASLETHKEDSEKLKHDNERLQVGAGECQCSHHLAGDREKYFGRARSAQLAAV